MNIIELTKKLITIPSYVDEKNDESEIGEYLFGLLRTACPWLKLTKQKVENKRFNIIAQDASEPKLIFVNHLDTVEQKMGGKFDPFLATVKKGKLYGLGAVDRKGGIAALLSALKSFEMTKGLMLLFYVDEEYDFKGMKKFVEACQVKPMLVVGCESNFEIVNGCRGLIEFSIQITGSSGHSARPNSGKNAIEGLFKAIEALKLDLSKLEDKTFGGTTFNLAYLKGGLRKGMEGNNTTLSKQGNNIPDYAEAVIEVRPSVEEVTADYVITVLGKEIANNDYKIDAIKIRHDLRGYKTEKKELTEIEKAIKKTGFNPKYRELKYRGYSDLAMINEQFNCPCANFGPKGANKHKANECVEIKYLNKCVKVYENLIRKFCT